MTVFPAIMEKDLTKERISYPETVYYPESDGEPMGETDFHINVILYLRQALRHLFRENKQVYVAADLLFYYEEGNPSRFIVPDVFVVKGVSRHDRRIYKLWEENVTPCVALEITSKSTRRKDLGSKRDLYEMLGVNEYFLFDPLDEYLSPRLQGFRLRGGYYQALSLSAEKTLYSQELDAILNPEGRQLRLVDPHSGEAAPTLDEAVTLAHSESERARVESERARVESERACVESERARVESERARVESERARVESERARAESERADIAEAEAARLRAELDRLRNQAS